MISTGSPARREHPDDGLVGARAFAHIDLIGFEADETRHGEARLAGGVDRRLLHAVLGAALKAGKEEESQRDARSEPDPKPMPHRLTPLWRLWLQPGKRAVLRIGSSLSPWMTEKSERTVAWAKMTLYLADAASVTEGGARRVFGATAKWPAGELPPAATS